MRRQPRILYIDAYDSFSHNVVGLLEDAIDASVRIVQIDDPVVAGNLHNVLQHFDAVVVGPGPGDPANARDIGFLNQLWALDEKNLIPILGICLGFQSMALAYGGEVRRLRQPRHGTVCRVASDGRGLFEGVDSLSATQYHSLHVILPDESKTQQSSIQHLEPVAWDFHDKANGVVLMALKVSNVPFWGVQFHPESICTSSGGRKIIVNWWNMAHQWATTKKRYVELATDPLLAVSATAGDSAIGISLTRFARTKFPSILPERSSALLWVELPLLGVSVTEICELLDLEKQKLVLLDSQGHASGRFSIVGLITPNETAKISFSLHNMTVNLSTVSGNYALKVSSSAAVWQLLQAVMDANWIDPHSSTLPLASPFWGGFMGYISYEAGLDIPDSEACNTMECNAADIEFAFVQKSIVIDHENNSIFVQHLGAQDRLWVDQTAQRLREVGEKSPASSCAAKDIEALDSALKAAYLEKPEKATYCEQVDLCQQRLACGDSYELCLTGETTVFTPRTHTAYVDPWMLYKRLRKDNPAPFGAFLSLPAIEILSSSPERFLQWTREGKFQYRPIKGTVERRAGVDLAAASKVLDSSKERAENLMIVDLIRHDISGMIGAKNCTVPRLMQVEEYQTVYQLVSVVEGQIPAEVDRKPSTSIDILKASLPPGSMTGAPKKRSCQILSKLEVRARGVYSGVVGYMDVGGGGDFSVVIRTAVKRKDEIVQKALKGSSCDDIVPHDTWRIGAGGAVTVQSTAVGEFREMESKLNSVLRTFQSGLSHQFVQDIVVNPLFRIRTSLRAIDRHFEEVPFSFHHARLLASARAFNMEKAVIALSRPCSKRDLKRQIDEHLNNLPCPSLPQKVDIDISCTGNARITSVALSPPLYTFNCFAEPYESQPFVTQVYLSPYSMEASVLTTHKTSHRTEYAKARTTVSISALPPTKAEVLLYNANEEVTEASFCTVYFYRNGQWLTPSSRSGCNVGTTRALALAQGWCIEGSVFRKDIRHLEIIKLSNGVRGYWWGCINLAQSLA